MTGDEVKQAGEDDAALARIEDHRQNLPPIPRGAFRLGVWHHASHRGPEHGRVLPVRQMNQAVLRHGVHQPHGGLHDPPVEPQVAFWDRRSPPAALVAYQHQRTGMAIFSTQIAARSGRRSAAWCRCQATTAFRTAVALPTGAVTTNRPPVSVTLVIAPGTVKLRNHMWPRSTTTGAGRYFAVGAPSAGKAGIDSGNAVS